MNRTELLKISKPILFNTEMVKAILDGRKTVTRRVLKVPSKYKNIPFVTARLVNTNGEIVTYAKGQPAPIIIPHPHQVGDVLYVRETWMGNGERFYYKADGKHHKLDNLIGDKPFFKWRPSIHMPKEAARIFLRITDVRVERLRDMKDIDAYKEGITDCKGNKCKGYELCDTLSNHVKKCFSYLWNSTIKKQDLDKYGWNSNPWVWVYEFERVECDERK